jgi:FecR protein/WD domain, G-beta repeat
MTRTDELTARLLDGTLSDAEWAELESLLAADPAAVNAHLALTELEAVLRGERAEFDLSEGTLAKVKVAQAEKTTQAVMAEIATHPAPQWAARPKPEPSSRRWLFAGSGLLVVAAAIFIGLWLANANLPQPRADDPSPIPANIEFATLTQSFGSVELLTPQGDVLTVTEGREVPPGHTLRTIGEDSLARVELPDHTTVDIEPDSVVRFVSVSSTSSKPRLFLAAGQLTAAVPDRASARPLIVGTGIADVFARKGTFVVSSAGPESARVDIKHGNVEVVRMDTQLPVKVAEGSAFFSAGFSKVDTEPGVRVDHTPARILSIPGARDAVYVPGSGPGKFDLWIASARQFTLWTSDGGTADTPLLPRKDGSVAFTRDRTSLVIGPGAKDDKLVIRNLPGCEERAAFEMKFPDVRFRAVAPGAAWLAIVEPKPNQKWLRVYDGTTGTERFAREFEDNVGSVASSPDGKTLAVGIIDSGRGGNNKIVLLDPATGNRTTTLPTQKKGLTALAFSNDGRFLAGGFNGLVQVWDVQSRELVRTITGFERVLTCLVFAGDGRMLAASTPEGQVWVWSVASGKAIQLIDVGSRGVRALAFSPDGKRLATVANNPPVALWDVATLALDEMQ